MNSKKLRLLILFLLLLPFLTVLFGAGCKEDEEYSNLVEGYIVGSFQCNGSEMTSFCIILKNNEDSMITSSLSENIFDFPSGVIKLGHDSFTGGPFFFPDSLRYNYKIEFKFRQPNEAELEECPMAYNSMGIPFSWENWNQVILTEVSKPK